MRHVYKNLLTCGVLISLLCMRICDGVNGLRMGHYGAIHFVGCNHIGLMHAIRQVWGLVTSSLLCMLEFSLNGLLFFSSFI